MTLDPETLAEHMRRVTDQVDFGGRGSLVYFTLTSANVYFASKLISPGTYNSSSGPSGSACGSILQAMPRPHRGKTRTVTVAIRDHKH